MTTALSILFSRKNTLSKSSSWASEETLIVGSNSELADAGRTMERETAMRIREAVRRGVLPKEFTPKEVNRLLRIHWAGVFLPKHREAERWSPAHAQMLPVEFFETRVFVQLSHREQGAV